MIAGRAGCNDDSDELRTRQSADSDRAGLLRVRWFMRAPSWLYRARLGVIFGHRLLMLEHVGKDAAAHHVFDTDGNDAAQNRPDPQTLLQVPTRGAAYRRDGYPGCPAGMMCWCHGAKDLAVDCDRSRSRRCAAIAGRGSQLICLPQ